jgi:hypothetical protein
MRAAPILFAAGLALTGGAVISSGWAAPAPPAPLKSASAFVSIQDPAARSVALFSEAGKVIQSPRCLNCHPVQRAPTQGDDLHPHDPPLQAGMSGHGVAGLPCLSCHGAANVKTWGKDIKTIPGDPKWGLAPVEMAWQGRSLGQICAQIKDPARNGGRTLAQIHDHMANDHLVGWGWNPGEGRRPAPGTQVQFGDLIQAWIDTGAKCPKA